MVTRNLRQFENKCRDTILFFSYFNIVIDILDINLKVRSSTVLYCKPQNGQTNNTLMIIGSKIKRKF
ncbi:hypothetical protein BpHYR1_037429 [Brachionus plicatilis]|uniref:Uncharacterized protein n=1 Tax=Brachionus plicatilis TaxID=10195 RepID=A0A3M7Q1G4_BRAPC|nr:hypothetical protein BpHYR1_037429 [Brachionus plicatilis]